jgi:hypothetical protein
LQGDDGNAQKLPNFDRWNVAPLGGGVGRIATQSEILPARIRDGDRFRQIVVYAGILMRLILDGELKDNPKLGRQS